MKRQKEEVGYGLNSEHPSSKLKNLKQNEAQNARAQSTQGS